MSRFLKGTTDHDGDGRMGGSLKETTMTTKKAATKNPMRKPKDTAPSENAQAHPFAYENGRQAAVSGISREQAPYADGDELKAWQEGYDSPRI